MANKKIAAADATAMNSLYKGELGRLGLKVAQKDAKDSAAGQSHDPQAFVDHDSYLSTLESILKEDSKVDGNSANDPITD
jgi:hypothetical protein